MSTCTIDGCDKKIHSKGMCSCHYYRVKRGTPLSSQKSCKNCGKEFTPAHAGTQHCSKECACEFQKKLRKEKLPPKILIWRPCIECGETFGAKTYRSKYCSTRCAGKYKRAKETKTCSIEGCNGRFLAKGLCATHYNNTRPNKYRLVKMQCSYCENTMLKEAGRDKKYANLYCSTTCRDKHRKAPRQTITLYKQPSQLEKAFRLLRYRSSAGSRTFVSTTCIICSSTFLDLYGSKACSDTCQQKHRKDLSRDGDQRRRARKRDAFVAPVFRREIYARDNYECKLCNHPLEMDSKVPDRLAPTIDHIVPLARGGTHEPSNVQSAHFICNALKGDREWKPLKATA